MDIIKSDCVKELRKCPIKNRMISIGCRKRQVRKGSVGIDLIKPEWADHYPLRFVEANALDLPFPNRFFGEVYASHIFEHMKVYKDERILALREWWRVLAFGGVLKIIVPNIDSYVRQYVEGKWNDSTFSNMMFGSQDSPYEFHYYGYTIESLANIVTQSLQNCYVKKMTVGRRGRFPINDLEIRGHFIKKRNKI